MIIPATVSVFVPALLAITLFIVPLLVIVSLLVVAPIVVPILTKDSR
jgi:hypothetical protein